MEGTTKALLACVAVALALIHAVTAADYVVGNPGGGWDGRTDYKSWAAAQTFAPGDTLTFRYNSYHNVLEVTKDAFEACATANPISFDNSGSTTVVLTMPGTRYFICGAPGHCLGGMKMEIEVADRPAPATPSSPPPLPPPPPPPPAARIMPWAPAPAPADAPPRHAGHKKQHRKKRAYCAPGTLGAPARPPTVQTVESLFPFAEVAPMSSTPPPPPATSLGGPAVARAARGEAAAALAALGGFMLLVL
ncbi:blue copper protein-like [Panicum miliaceum]|uniref:Blue copper protein-like n=1 Tax=Panicum miliaceum TaxID=4540 RepID=A0A3L6SMQ9_PANMI|nr:blue copper protein-like [Panicum miliaceum]